LTVANLSKAIQQAIYDKNIKKRASGIGQQIGVENGVEVALNLIEGFVRNGHL
jgi:UDP:flavonoid glycosyltransferase YjiC (YdhE family)